MLEMAIERLDQTTKTSRSPTPSTWPLILSPFSSAPTPAGVPVKMRSPALSSNSSDRNCDLVRDVPDHLREIAGLAALAVDVDPDRALCRDGRSCRPAGWPCRARSARRPCRPPRGGRASSYALQIAAGHVEADGVAVHVPMASAALMFTAAGLQRDDQLDLEVHVLGRGGVGKLASSSSMLSAFFWKKNGGSLFGSWPISMACSA